MKRALRRNRRGRTSVIGLVVDRRTADRKLFRCNIRQRRSGSHLVVTRACSAGREGHRHSLIRSDILITERRAADGHINRIAGENRAFGKTVERR